MYPILVNYKKNIPDINFIYKYVEISFKENFNYHLVQLV